MKNAIPFFLEETFFTIENFDVGQNNWNSKKKNLKNEK